MALEASRILPLSLEGNKTGIRSYEMIDADAVHDNKALQT
jgi:hypothetical protein